jgi:hypothetical protein
MIQLIRKFKRNKEAEAEILERMKPTEPLIDVAQVHTVNQFLVASAQAIKEIDAREIKKTI